MLMRFVVLSSFIFPLIGVWMMESGAVASSIVGPNGYKMGHENGATFAFLFYTLTAFFTVKLSSRTFSGFGKVPKMELRNPDKVNRRVLPFMIFLLLVMLYAVGGASNYAGTTNAGTFRAALDPIAGIFGGIILKYIAPATFAFALMTNVAWDKSRVRSPTILSLGVIMCLIGGTYGFKSSFVMAVFPAAVLYYWRSRVVILIPLAAIATAAILFGYWYFTTISDVGTALDKFIDRLFVAQGDVPWYLWDQFVGGLPMPNYYATLLPIFGDRIASAITGITIETREAWVMSHFSLMITQMSGYDVDTILGGHNNTATAFSEGLLAGGLTGVFVFAILAGIVINLIYSFIDNKLRAHDYVQASIAASYFVYAIMPWLISGGLQSMVHISIPVLFFVTWVVLEKLRCSATPLITEAQKAAL